jgi:hypothetical protein
VMPNIKVNPSKALSCIEAGRRGEGAGKIVVVSEVKSIAGCSFRESQK